MTYYGNLSITRQLQDWNPGLLKFSVLPTDRTDSPLRHSATNFWTQFKLDLNLRFLEIGKGQEQTHIKEKEKKN